MKKLFAVFTMGLAIAAQACWFTSANFNAGYIAGGGSPYASHYTEASYLASAIYTNNQSVPMPLTVYIKVSPRYPDQTGESAGEKPVTKAVLQYKILPAGSWVTVRTIENVSWSMNWNRPVPLFGRNCIDIPNLASGTAILIRLYLTDGTYETGDLSAALTDTIPDSATGETNTRYSGGWSAPYVWKVIYNGKRRARQ